MKRACSKLFVSLGWVLCVVLLGAACAADVERTPVAQMAGGNPAHGKALLDGYGCTSCHTVPDIRGADATIGPPLTDWGRRRYIAGLLINEPDNLMRWIQAPQAVKPGVVMPNLGVTTGDARDIAAYLYTLGVDARAVRPAPDDITATPAATATQGAPAATPTQATPTTTATEAAPTATPMEAAPTPTPTEAAPTVTPTEAAPTATPAAGQNLIAMGEPIYNQDCASCHGEQGGGVAGRFPPHAGNPLVTGDPAPVIEIVLNGSGDMPAFGDELSDEEIAAVISYIRNAWGNDAALVSPGDVAAAR